MGLAKVHSEASDVLVNDMTIQLHTSSVSGQGHRLNEELSVITLVTCMMSVMQR